MQLFLGFVDFLGLDFGIKHFGMNILGINKKTCAQWWIMVLLCSRNGERADSRHHVPPALHALGTRRQQNEGQIQGVN